MLKHLEGHLREIVAIYSNIITVVFDDDCICISLLGGREGHSEEGSESNDLKQPPVHKDCDFYFFFHPLTVFILIAICTDDEAVRLAFIWDGPRGFSLDIYHYPAHLHFGIVYVCVCEHCTFMGCLSTTQNSVVRIFFEKYV